MTSIEWTRGDDGTPGKTWNPVTGCTKVSAGCKNCYAEKVADRFWESQYPPIVVQERPLRIERPRRFTDVQCHPDRLDQPLRWRKPRRVFVNSMSDLFHKDVPDKFIAAVFGVMASAQRHTFQVLTKRPERMLKWFSWIREQATQCYAFNGHHEVAACVIHAQIATDEGSERLSSVAPWPLPNVWLGVSAENQPTADERIPLLLQTPAAVRFVSAEPLLGAINLSRQGLWLMKHWRGAWNPEDADEWWWEPQALRGAGQTMLDWVIVGGESGPGARPCDVEWVRPIVKQCKAAKVACFVKQLGAKPRGWCVNRLIPGSIPADDGFCDSYESGEGGDCGDRCFMLKNRKGGDPEEWPEDLRVREFPTVGGPS